MGHLLDSSYDSIEFETPTPREGRREVNFKISPNTACKKKTVTAQGNDLRCEERL